MGNKNEDRSGIGLGFRQKEKKKRTDAYTSSTMRPLTEDESKAVFEKLANYIASNSLSSPALVLMLPVQREKISYIWWTGRMMRIVFGCTRVASFMSPKPQCGSASR